MENFIDTNKNNASCCKENIKLTNNNNNYSDFLNGTVKISTDFICEMNQDEPHEQSNLDTTSVDEEVAVSSGQIFHNEGLIEEIILLPNNLILSDEESNSDDCIYAYRGRGVVNSPEYPAECNDDETDFLEMDFDPEPNSELENFNEGSSFNHLESNFFSLNRENFENCPPQPPEVAVSNEEYPKNTGAKPKTRSAASNCDGLQLNKIQSNGMDSNLKNQRWINAGPCLDCAEIEFIKQTKPDADVESKCPIHCSKQANTNSFDVFSENSLSTISLRSNLQSTDEPIPQFTQFNNKQQELMVTIYSVNCDNETIIEATNRIGLKLNTEIIRQYFEVNLMEEDSATTVLSVPEYLLYISKRNCNYKKLMDLIKAASSESIDVHFYPQDTVTDSTVQINAEEIIKRWNPSTDLRQILKFKNKNFRNMNVLGKVINIIRNADRSRIANWSISIPQYYKTGYICITRSNFLPWS